MFAFVLVITTHRLLFDPFVDLLKGVLIEIMILLLLVCWIFGEMRTKIIKVIINDSRVSVRNYFGFGRERIFDFKQFSGFKISFLPTGSSSYEFLYLMIDNKKVIKISKFYHSNYDKLKEVIEVNMENLGIEEFSFVDEMKEVMGKTIF